MMIWILVLMLVLKCVATWLTRADTAAKSADFSMLHLHEEHKAEEPVMQPEPLHTPAVFKKAV